MLLLIGSAMTRPVFTTQEWMTPISAWTTQVEISDQFFGWALGFGKKEKLKRTIIVSNKGKSVLDISTLQLFTRGIDVMLPKRQLRPGESTKMKITGHADILKTVRRRPRILMITNDPTKQKVIIEIKK